MSEGIRMRQTAPVYIKENDELIRVGSYKTDLVIEATKDYGNWLVVDFADQEAFVWKAVTEKVKKNFIKPPIYGKLITSKECDIYSNTNEEPTGILLEGVEIPLVEKVNNDWYLTFLSGRHFYIGADSVQELEA